VTAPDAARTEAELRTFLIADIRGYTAYTHDEGADAAAALAGRFASIVREVVTAHDGLLLELRGDEALVVFVLARRALRAAIELQSRFAVELSRGVGIGMDAGEAIPVEGGYRGSALNLAARLCGQAGPGETLASEAVVHLAAKVEGIGYADPRTFRLKGMDGPVRAVHVVPAEKGSTVPIRFPDDGRRPGAVAVIAIGIAGIAVVAIAGVMLSGAFGDGRTGRSSPDPVGAVGTASYTPASPAALAGGTSDADPSGGGAPGSVVASPRPLRLSDGVSPHVTTAPGVYATTAFTPAVVFDLGTGWEAMTDAPDNVEMDSRTRRTGPPDGAVTFLRLQVVNDTPCHQSGTRTLGHTRDDVLQWVSSRPYLTVDDPEPVEVGGFAGVRLRARVAARPPDCPSDDATLPLGFSAFPLGSGDFFLPVGEQVDFTVLDVRGDVVAMIVEARAGHEADVGSKVAVLLRGTSFP
jgi:class 3 adenylate cyclase